MADTKVSNLTAITGANIATNDLVPVVDVSDSTMNASGTDKKTTVDDFSTALGIPAVQTQTALQAAQIECRRLADLGQFVGSGLTLSANATPTKLNMAAGVAYMGTADLSCAAQSAIATTITSLADATNPKWVVVELDSSSVVQFTQGTAAAAPAFPTITTTRTPLGFLYVPANATQVDTLLTTSNGLAKLIDARNVRIGPASNGWCYDQNTWTYSSSTTGAGAGLITFTVNGVDATGYLKPGIKVSWDDGTNTPGYGVINTSSFSTNTTVTLIKQSDYVMANHALAYPKYSEAQAPVGFPAFFNWSPTLVGWASAGGTDPTNTVYTWWQSGPRIMTVTVRQLTNGTSGATAHSATLPATAQTLSNQTWTCLGTAVDSGTTQTGVAVISSAGTTVSLASIFLTANNTASGANRFGNAQIQYAF